MVRRGRRPRPRQRRRRRRRRRQLRVMRRRPPPGDDRFPRAGAADADRPPREEAAVVVIVVVAFVRRRGVARRVRVPVVQFCLALLLRAREVRVHGPAGGCEPSVPVHRAAAPPGGCSSSPARRIGPAGGGRGGVRGDERRRAALSGVAGIVEGGFARPVLVGVSAVVIVVVVGDGVNVFGCAVRRFGRGGSGRRRR